MCQEVLVEKVTAIHIAAARTKETLRASPFLHTIDYWTFPLTKSQNKIIRTLRISQKGLRMVFQYDGRFPQSR